MELKVSKKKKQAGKKAADTASLPVRRIDHYMSEDELTAEFGENGWKQLLDAVSRCYKFILASVEVEEHHIGVYSSKQDEHIVKAPPPAEPASWQPCFPVTCSGGYKWKICKCRAALPSRKRIRKIWPCHYEAEHGELDDPSG